MFALEVEDRLSGLENIGMEFNLRNNVIY